MGLLDMALAVAGKVCREADPAAAPCEDRELVDAVNAAADREGWSNNERAEAIQHALNAPEGRLPVLRALAPPQVTPRTQRDSGAIGTQPAGLESLQSAQECGRCRSLDMQEGPNYSGRRQFQWTCMKGHRILRGGVGLEDVLLAPPTCNDFDDRPINGPGVFH